MVKTSERLRNVSDKGMEMMQRMMETTEWIRNVGDKRMRMMSERGKHTYLFVCMRIPPLHATCNVHACSCKRPL